MWCSIAWCNTCHSFSMQFILTSHIIHARYILRYVTTSWHICIIHLVWCGIIHHYVAFKCTISCQVISTFIAAHVASHYIMSYFITAHLSSHYVNSFQIIILILLFTFSLSVSLPTPSLPLSHSLSLTEPSNQIETWPQTKALGSTPIRLVLERRGTYVQNLLFS